MQLFRTSLFPMFIFACVLVPTKAAPMNAPQTVLDSPPPGPPPGLPHVPPQAAPHAHAQAQTPSPPPSPDGTPPPNTVPPRRPGEAALIDAIKTARANHEGYATKDPAMDNDDWNLYNSALTKAKSEASALLKDNHGMELQEAHRRLGSGHHQVTLGMIDNRDWTEGPERALEHHTHMAEAHRDLETQLGINKAAKRARTIREAHVAGRNLHPDDKRSHEEALQKARQEAHEYMVAKPGLDPNWVHTGLRNHYEQNLMDMDLYQGFSEKDATHHTQMAEAHDQLAQEPVQAVPHPAHHHHATQTDNPRGLP